MKRSELLKLQNFIRDNVPSGSLGGPYSDEEFARDEGVERTLDYLKDTVAEFEVTEEDVTLCSNGDPYVHELGYAPMYPRKSLSEPMRHCEPCMAHRRGTTNA